MRPSSDDHDLLAFLRSETRESHLRIERAMDLDGPFSRARYVQALQAFEAFLSAWEPRVARVLTAEDRAWFASRSRTEWARTDLQVLGAAPRADLLALQEVQVPSSNFAFGGMYVIEGSALGGQVIADRARLRHGIHRDNGGLFFGGRGACVGSMWREFRAKLTCKLTDDHLGRAAAAAGAVATFAALTSVVEEAMAG